MIRYDTTRYGTVRHGMAWHGMTRHSTTGQGKTTQLNTTQDKMGLGLKKAHSIRCKYKQTGWLRKTSLTLTSRALLQTALLHRPLIVANVSVPLELSEGVGQGLFPQHNGELEGVVVPWGEG